MTIDDDRIKNVFKSYQIIAAVGMSRSMKKSSNWIPVYLSTKNYEIIPVNPNASHIKQWKSYPDLKSIPGKIDILLIFLPSSVAVDIVKNAIERKRNKGDIQVIWLQEGSEERARELAEQEGITFIQGRDIYREYKRLMVNPGIEMLLAGDIGATKTILAVFTKEKGPIDPLVQEEIVTASYSGVDELVQAFLNKAGLKVSNACFGIAAPVVKGEATMLNMPWVVRESHLRRALNMTEVRLLNDLEAIAAAVPRLVEDDVHILNPGMPEPGAAIAVIAPGTGLGEGFLTWDGRRYHARASEGGHVEFGPANALQIELLRHLGEKFEHVSYERVCCGPGIFNIYDFLRQKSLAEVPEWLSKELAGVPDPTPVIVDAAMDPVKRCRICEMALDIFASILGAEAGNLALKVMATNGVYLAGGIPPRILKILENGKFMQSFRNKGRESFILSQIPVKVIMNTRAGLIGAASYGLENFT